MTGWWFQTFFIFHNIWDNPSHWLIFFRWVETTNQLGYSWWWVAQTVSFTFHSWTIHILGGMDCEVGDRGLCFRPGKSKSHLYRFTSLNYWLSNPLVLFCVSLACDEKVEGSCIWGLDYYQNLVCLSKRCFWKYVSCLTHPQKMEGTVFHPTSSARICGIDQQGPFFE